MKKLLCKGIMFLSLLTIPIFSFAYGLAGFENQNVAVSRMWQGYVVVIPLDSVYVKSYNPPHYIISGTVYTVNTNTNQIVSSKGTTTYFNYDTKGIFSYDEKTGTWHSDNNWGSGFEAGRQAFYNKIFYKCYRIPFF